MLRSLLVFLLLTTSVFSKTTSPNFVIIFLDDSGWGDFKPFGNPAYETPNVERLAKEGCRFNRFYVPQAICSASRSALMTGCYPGRTKVFGAHPPRARGLDPKFPMLSEVLKKRGYHTGVFGKWHLGDQAETRPPARGFTESSGLMYSNDMWKYHPGTRHFDKWPLQFWENGKITIEDVSPEDQKSLTKWSTKHAVDFITRHKGKPFFLYVPHSMPHVPLYCSDEFAGKSGAGIYGDVMMEIDWSVGRILDSLKKSGVEDNTVVIFTSDNGPWISYGDHAGVTPFREAKATSFDGGKRVACIMKYPGHIAANTQSERVLCTIDIMPTFATLAGAKLPESPIDGKNVIDLIVGKKGATHPHESYALSIGSGLQAVISADGRWKLHLPHRYRTLVKAGEGGKPGKTRQEKIELSLFDLKNDPAESKNVIKDHPEVAKKMQALAEKHQRLYKSSPVKKP
jgi:arylsulfatase A-like enzyme